MRKIVFVFGVLVFATSQAHAVHNLIFRDASSLTTGTVNNSLLDNSSITKRGNDWDDQIDASTTSLRSIVLIATTSIGQLKRDYDLYVGTPGTVGTVDVIANETNSFNSAFASVPVNARGLTINTSAHATIFVSPGIYDVCGATIPQGVSVWATPGSSTVFRPTSDVCRMFTVYGELHNVILDLQGRAHAGQIVSVATGGVVTGFTVENADSINQAAVNQYTTFMVEYATNVRIEGTFNSYAGTSQDNYRGGLVTVWYSSNVYINLKVKGGRYDATGRQSFFIAGSREVTIDGDYQRVGGRMILSYGGNKDIFIRGKYHITGGHEGFILIKPAEFGRASTGTYISAHFIHDVNDTSSIIDLNDGSPDFPLDGVSITGCTAITTQGAGSTPSPFVTVRANNARVIFTNNRLYGMASFISDSGNSTQYQTLGNFLNGILQ